MRRNDDTVSILSLMLPHLDKKQDEARAAIDYPTDKIDGVELATRINEQVKIGERMGKRLLPEDFHSFKYEGAILGRMRAALTKKSRALITPESAERIAKDYESGLSQRDLAKVYGVSQSYISRIISKQLRA